MPSEQPEIKRVDTNWLESINLTFRDDGYISPGSKTRKYSVFSKHNGSLLGIVKWFIQWRQYVFYPYNALFNSKCLIEVATFCEQSTLTHRERTGRKPPVYKKRLEAKAKYY